MPTTIEQMAAFAAELNFDALPPDVVHETKRLLLDSAGCAIAAVASEKGRWGRTYASTCLGGSAQATVMGYGDRLSVAGAAFLNAELINGLDHDAGMTPGHVSPFVIPPALATGELGGNTGRDIITALAVAHELSNRIGENLGTFRDIVDGKARFPLVAGYSFSVFGGTAAVAMLKGMPADRLAGALGLAGQLAPMQTHAAMMKDLPTTTAKYLMAGWAAQAQIAAAALAEAGHWGDVQILDQPWGYWRFAGSARWDEAAALAGLGETWRFHKTTRYKIYPSCRIMHGALDCLAEIIAEQGLLPDEIEHVHAWLEASCTEPVFSTRAIRNQTEAQFCVAYNIAVMAHGVPPGPVWQSEETINDPRIIGFMDRVSFEPHPDYVEILAKDSRARISRVQVTARGTTFRKEKKVAKGAPSDDPSTYMTDEDIVAKFLSNAANVIGSKKAELAAELIMGLETAPSLANVMENLRP